MKIAPAALFAAILASPLANADEDRATLPPVQVTATRDAQSVETLPASVSIVDGDELRSRGANDLRSALLLVAGVEGTPTGDGGPAGSVPALWGLREIDSFLLVIDGVPSGGAFNPLTTQVDLTGVERIEILRGAAPVMFGATSFNGVIHVIHYAPGKSPTVVGASGGSHGSAGAYAFAGIGESQSLVANVERRGFSVDDMKYDRIHLLYRAGRALGEDGFRLDADVSILPQAPGSVTFRNGATLRRDLVPDDANHNPSDAKMDQKHYQLNAGYQAGPWSATLSLAHTKDDIVRGFHEANATTAAHGYEQEREVNDLYFDSHLTHALAPGFKLSYGVDYLYGVGEQEAFRFPYAAAVDGSSRQDSASAKAACPGSATNPDECFEFETEVERNFAGIYAQAEWTPVPVLNVMAGLRMNQTDEAQEGEDDSTAPPSQVSVKDSNTRLSGVIGATWTAWRSGNSSLNAYADYRNGFKPIAAELGPEPEVNILEPETSDSYELGFKGALAEGRLHYDASVFRFDFRNMKTKVVDPNTSRVVNGNAGETRFQGGEFELRFALAQALELAGHYAYHDTDFIRFNRNPSFTAVASVDGNRFEMSPMHSAGAGLLYAPATGLNCSLLGNYTGERNLNKSNTAKQGGFYTYDASLGYEFGRFGVQLAGHNLSDRRDAIAESELSEEVTSTGLPDFTTVGASNYYLLPGRSVTLSLHMNL
ncbi:MAG TPA: TonB-dependent receptor [Verrucomicrobiae bacterium]|nr:TonB-dependent receptor [Verrucomicrobiae bacterium]